MDEAHDEENYNGKGEGTKKGKLKDWNDSNQGRNSPKMLHKSQSRILGEFRRRKFYLMRPESNNTTPLLETLFHSVIRTMYRSKRNSTTVPQR